jgi:hypothetical protein
MVAGGGGGALVQAITPHADNAHSEMTASLAMPLSLHREPALIDLGRTFRGASA